MAAEVTARHESLPQRIPDDKDAMIDGEVSCADRQILGGGHAAADPSPSYASRHSIPIIPSSSFPLLHFLPIIPSVSFPPHHSLPSWKSLSCRPHHSLPNSQSLSCALPSHSSTHVHHPALVFHHPVPPSRLYKPSRNAAIRSVSLALRRHRDTRIPASEINKALGYDASGKVIIGRGASPALGPANGSLPRQIEEITPLMLHEAVKESGGGDEEEEVEPDDLRLESVRLETLPLT